MFETDLAGRTHVVAAVLRDARGRVLLGRRGDGRGFAGAWEFPGGKVEPGELPRLALARELHEELGIRIDPDSLRTLIAVPCEHGGKRIVLDVFEAPRWRGRPRGREGQALIWTAPERLDEYTMPPADLPVVAALRAPPYYPISPDLAAIADEAEEVAFLRILDALLTDGARRIQLRARLPDRQRFALLAARCLARCREAGAQCLINGDARLAMELGCGLHLPAAQLLSLKQRPLPNDLPVAASCHDRIELGHAQTLGLDFAVLGPVRATASHPGAEPIGWDAFATLRETVSLPIYALGGLGPTDLSQARRYGAQGIAGIRAFWPAWPQRRSVHGASGP